MIETLPQGMSYHQIVLISSSQLPLLLAHLGKVTSLSLNFLLLFSHFCVLTNSKVNLFYVIIYLGSCSSFCQFSISLFFMKEASAINLTTLSFSSTTFSRVENLDLKGIYLALLHDEWSLFCSFSSSFGQLCTLCFKENRPDLVLVLFMYLLKAFMDIHQRL